jgi:hypothetical protein
MTTGVRSYPAPWGGVIDSTSLALCKSVTRIMLPHTPRSNVLETDVSDATDDFTYTSDLTHGADSCVMYFSTRLPIPLSEI